MQGVAAQRRVVFSQLEFFGFELLIAGGGVARRGFAFFSRLGAFNRNDFPWHGLFLFFWLLFRLVFLGLYFSHAHGIDGAQRAQPALTQGPLSL